MDASVLAQADGGIVDLKEKFGKAIKPADGEADSTTYHYDHATIEKRDGKTVTGIKVQKVANTNNYRLYYTSDSTVNSGSDWTAYNDSVSRSSSNNADIYLIYTTGNSNVTSFDIKYHPVDEYGGQLFDSFTPYSSVTTSGTTYTSSWNGFGNGIYDNLHSNAGSNSSPVPESYSYDKTYFGVFGQSESLARFADSDTKRTVSMPGVFYKYDTSTKTWHTGTGTRNGNSVSVELMDDNGDPVLYSDLYLVYKGVKGLTVHYVDSDGNLIQDDTFKQYTDSTAKLSVSDIATNPEGYSVNPTMHLDSYTGTTVSALSYTKDGDNWTSRYYTNDNDNGTTTESPINEVWLVYTKNTDSSNLTIHYVDTDGNAINGKASETVAIPRTVDSASEKDSENNNVGYTNALMDTTSRAISGYTLQNVYINSMKGAEAPVGTRIIYKVDSTGKVQSYYTRIDFSSSAYAALSNKQALAKIENGGTSFFQYPIQESDELITDVYLVYNQVKSKTFTVHHIYITKDNKQGTTNQSNTTFTLTNNREPMRLTTTAEDETQLKQHYPNLTGQGGQVLTNVTRNENGTAVNLTYLGTRIQNYLGFNATSVYVDSDGTIMYQTGVDKNNAGSSSTTGNTTYTLSRSEEDDDWTGSGSNGRNFTVTQDNDENYILNDSQHGDINLNLSVDGSTSKTYTATFHGEGETTVYIAVRNDQEISLTVSNYVPSTSTDIYQVYVDQDSANSSKVWIDDDLQYTGMLNVKLANDVDREVNPTSANGGLDSNGKSVYGTVSNIVYEWHRIETPVDQDGNTTSDAKDIAINTEARKKTGDHWNIAFNAKDRTWLDVEADEGTDVWTSGTKRQYYVKLTYDLDNGAENPTKKEYTSAPITINYYGQLENGSFEVPVIQNQNHKYTWGNETNPVNGYISNNSDEAKYSAGGVWKTTSTI